MFLTNGTYHGPADDRVFLVHVIVQQRCQLLSMLSEWNEALKTQHKEGNHEKT